jgi:hypothetical protein
MDLPIELQPTTTKDVSLPSGIIRQLPVCNPVFAEWVGERPSFDFGHKPFLKHDGEACFAELVILRLLLKQGWKGVWVESFAGPYYLNDMPKDWKTRPQRVLIPEDKEKILKDIWRTGRTRACFDVFAWTDSQSPQFLFCEAKDYRNRDKFTRGQLRFIDAALTIGISPQSLLIVEWISV